MSTTILHAGPNTEVATPDDPLFRLVDRTPSADGQTVYMYDRTVNVLNFGTTFAGFRQVNDGSGYVLSWGDTGGDPNFPASVDASDPRENITMTQYDSDGDICQYQGTKTINGTYEITSADFGGPLSESGGAFSGSVTVTDPDYAELFYPQYTGTYTFDGMDYNATVRFQHRDRYVVVSFTFSEGGNVEGMSGDWQLQEQVYASLERLWSGVSSVSLAVPAKVPGHSRLFYVTLASPDSVPQVGISGRDEEGNVISVEEGVEFPDIGRGVTVLRVMEVRDSRFLVERVFPSGSGSAEGEMLFLCDNTHTTPDESGESPRKIGDIVRVDRSDEDRPVLTVSVDSDFEQGDFIVVAGQYTFTLDLVDHMSESASTGNFQYGGEDASGGHYYVWDSVGDSMVGALVSFVF